MGDRGNIVVRQERDTSAGDVWFYGHWSGSILKNRVQEALKLNERWQDPSYLARIIFDKFTQLEGDTTGFGISTRMQDNEYDILVVDIPGQCVYETSEKQLTKEFRLKDNPERVNHVQWTFEQFITENFEQ